MIITRTPFRITLGGGGTDIPSYYEKKGGFLLTSAIDKYMYLAINTPFIDKLLRVKYSKSETVESVNELEHELAKEALKHYGIKDALEVISFADISAGTGMGSSSCYLIGLLKGLETYKRTHISAKEMAEVACDIEINILKKPIGKQDAYIAAQGGILVMDINKNGEVNTRSANIQISTLHDLEYNLLLYYSGIQRKSEEILVDQNTAMLEESHKCHKEVSKSLDKIKELGYASLKALEHGKTAEFGALMDEHWQFKKKMSDKISNSRIDNIYEEAKKRGALGGKILGAGGGGFLLLYAEKGHKEIDDLMKKEKMRRLNFRFDFEGSKTLLNLADSRIGYQHDQEKRDFSCPQ